MQRDRAVMSMSTMLSVHQAQARLASASIADLGSRAQAVQQAVLAVAGATCQHVLRQETDTCHSHWGFRNSDTGLSEASQAGDCAGDHHCGSQGEGKGVWQVADR